MTARFRGGAGGAGGGGAGWRKKRNGGGGGGGEGSSNRVEPRTTRSATSAAALSNSKRGFSFETPEWPAPSCADAQIVFLAFDILSVEGECVAGRPLSERKELLRAAIVGEDEYLKDTADEVDDNERMTSARSTRTLLASDSHEIPRSCSDPGRRGGLRIGASPGNPMRGRLLAMVPGAPLRSLGTRPPRCELAATKAEVEEAAKRAEENGEEGVMIKSLASQWIPGAYRNAWVKIKPEYGKVKRTIVFSSFSFFFRGRRKKNILPKNEKKNSLFFLP